MKRGLIIAALLVLSACGKAAPKSIVFTGQSLVLPDAVATFPATPAGEALTTNCTACHSPEMILNQPVLGAEKWQGEIDKMRTVYKAQIAEGGDATLVKALVELPTQRVGTGSAPE